MAIKRINAVSSKSQPEIFSPRDIVAVVVGQVFTVVDPHKTDEFDGYSHIRLIRVGGGVISIGESVVRDQTEIIVWTTDEIEDMDGVSFQYVDEDFHFDFVAKAR